MAYATSNVYSAELLEMASSKVDELTYNRIKSIGINNLTVFQRSAVESATLAQAKYYDEYGTEAGAMSGFSILDTSISFNDSGSTRYTGVSPLCITYLKQTGLMSRVVG